MGINPGAKLPGSEFFTDSFVILSKLPNNFCLTLLIYKMGIIVAPVSKVAVKTKWVFLCKMMSTLPCIFKCYIYLVVLTL